MTELHGKRSPPLARATQLGHVTEHLGERHIGPDDIDHIPGLHALDAAPFLLQTTVDDVHLIVLPLFHSFGQTVLMNAGLSRGNTLVLIPRFTPEGVLGAMQAEKVTVFAGVPTIYWALLTY